MKALIVGLDPALLDQAPEPADDVTAERVRAAMDDAVASLTSDGIETELLLLAGPTEQTLTGLRTALVRQHPDAVMIGAGVRLEPSLSWFLERMVNLVVEVAPRAKLCFNDDPEAMATAIRRVLPLPDARMDAAPFVRASGATLRLLWPQWQGATADNVADLAPELPLESARRGYAVGNDVLRAVLPQHDGPTALVPVDMGDDGLEERDGLEAKDAILRQLAAAVELVREHDTGRILTLGGECSVSVAPFTSLAAKYGDDLAVLWIDSHPDIGTGDSEYHGYHAMAVSAITGHGDQDVLDELPAVVPAERVALVGLHDWTEDDFPNVTSWGLSTFAPDDLRTDSSAVLAWLKSTGATKVAIHFDVDTIDSDEVAFGLGAVPGGLTSANTQRIVADVDAEFDVVGLTIAEFIPRQVMRLTALVSDFPLISPR